MATCELRSAPPTTNAVDETPPDGEAIETGLSALPMGGDAALLDLRAAASRRASSTCWASPCRSARMGRTARAFSLADLSWTALKALHASTPLLINLGAPLDLRRASEQLCIEELARRANDRPVRLIVRGLGPPPPRLLSRLLEAVTAHPDLELWVGDAVSRRYATSVLERAPSPPGAAADAVAVTGACASSASPLVEPGTLGATLGL